MAPLTSVTSRAFTLESKIDVLEEKPVSRPDFPVPDDTGLLFYIQRSTNSNTIVYTASITQDGKIAVEKPVKAYWRRFASNGKKKPLNYIEEKFAFGILSSNVQGGGEAVQVHLTSLPSRRATVVLNNRREAIATFKMGRYQARLLYAYISVDESSLLPWVHYVDVFGVDLESGKYLRERIRPVDGPEPEPEAR